MLVTPHKPNSPAKKVPTPADKKATPVKGATPKKEEEPLTKKPRWAALFSEDAS